MSDRVHELLRARAGGKTVRWLFPSKRSKCGHLTNMANQFRLARERSGLPEDLVLYCGRHDYGHSRAQQYREPGGGHEDDGAQGCENCHAVPTS